MQSRLELVYKQQKVIKDYENQILNLKEQNQFLEKVTNNKKIKIKIIVERNDYFTGLAEKIWSLD